jgi:hypothetical protein
MKVRPLLSADLCGGTPRRSRHPLQVLDLCSLMTSSGMPTEAVQRFQLEMVGLPLLKPDSYLYAVWHLLLCKRG